MKCRNILLVDDDIDIREMIREILIDEGYFITTAENGKEALDFLKSCSPSELPGCIILDLMMPVMTGTQFLYAIQDEASLAQIPVVVASAKGNSKEDFVGLPGNVEKIKKPMDLDELLNIISKHCGDPLT